AREAGAGIGRPQYASGTAAPHPERAATAAQQPRRGVRESDGRPARHGARVASAHVRRASRRAGDGRPAAGADRRAAKARAPLGTFGAPKGSDGHQERPVGSLRPASRDADEPEENRVTPTAPDPSQATPAQRRKWAQY